jgi:hypothetical protein
MLLHIRRWLSMTRMLARTLARSWHFMVDLVMMLLMTMFWMIVTFVMVLIHDGSPLLCMQLRCKCGL